MRFQQDAKEAQHSIGNLVTESKQGKHNGGWCNGHYIRVDLVNAFLSFVICTNTICTNPKPLLNDKQTSTT